MALSINAVRAKRPEMTLRQSLVWDYYFENGWVCIETDNGNFIIMDESDNLNTATILPDKDRLYDWLDFEADDLMAEDPLGFFGSFFRISAKDYEELLTDEVLAAMVRAAESSNSKNESPRREEK